MTHLTGILQVIWYYNPVPTPGWPVADFISLPHGYTSADLIHESIRVM